MSGNAKIKQPSWYVLRDLTRPNAKMPGYLQLRNEGIEVFTPMRTVFILRQGHKIKQQKPLIHDLLFVHSTRAELDPVIENTSTLQYRYIKGRAYCDPLTVDELSMNRFIAAANARETPRYYTLEELSGLHFGKKIRIISNDILNGYEAELISIRGGRKKKILVQLPGLLSVEYEVQPDYIQFL